MVILTHTELFNKFASLDLVLLVWIFGSISIVEVYLRYKFGKNAWKCDMFFNAGLIMFNGFIIYMMLNSNIEKNSLSLFIFGVAVVQTCKLLRDTLAEIADQYNSKRASDKRIIEIEIDAYTKILNTLNSLSENNEEIRKEKLEIINRIMHLEKQLIKYDK
jgi:hypothetical protein